MLIKMEEIDLKELFSMFWKKKTIILITVVVFAIIGLIYAKAIKVPMYSSSTTLVLAQSKGENVNSITTTDITLNSKLVSTYGEIIKSSSTLRDVIKNLELKENEAELKKNIKVSEVEGTEVIKITVTHKKSEEAARIANEIGKVFINKISDIYKIDNVQVLDSAEQSVKPSNIDNKKDVLIFIVIGLVISCGYIFVLNIFDNTVKSKEDIENTYKLPVLATILETKHKAKKGGRI